MYFRKECRSHRIDIGNLEKNNNNNNKKTTTTKKTKTTTTTKKKQKKTQKKTKKKNTNFLHNSIHLVSLLIPVCL